MLFRNTGIPGKMKVAQKMQEVLIFAQTDIFDIDDVNRVMTFRVRHDTIDLHQPKILSY